MKRYEGFLAGLSVFAVCAFILGMVCVICYTLCSAYNNDELRESVREHQDTIYQLRLQVIELESELEIKNHWEE